MANESQSFGELPALVKVLILGGVILLITVLYYFLFHGPLMGSIAGAKADNVRLQGERTQAENRQKEFVELNDALAKRQAVDKQHQKVLPADSEIAAFLQDLNRLGELSGLEFKLIEPRPEEEVGGAAEESAQAPQSEEVGATPVYVRIPVSLQMKGRYHQVAKFFYNVSKLDRAISMEDVQLKNPEIVGDEVVLDVHVLATTFRRPDAAAGAPAAGGGA